MEHDETVTRVTFSIVIGALMLTLNLLLSEYAPDLQQLPVLARWLGRVYELEFGNRKESS